MTGVAWKMDLPPEWLTGRWLVLDAIAESDLLHGQALLVSGILSDSTNVMAVLWPAGQRLLRMGPPTDWALQEHYCGRPPSAVAGGDTIEMMWRVAVDSIIEAKAQTVAECGPPPGWRA